MNTAVVDIETDGFKEVATKIHCIVAKCYDTGDVRSWVGKEVEKFKDWSKDIDLLSQAQLTYCANDVIFLKKIKEELLKILIREGRENLYKQTIKWLPVRVQLDLAGYSDTDLFSHS